MPSRKQRRRRQKLQRHEYEYVVETEEGEIPLEQLREDDGEGHPRRDRTAKGRSDSVVDRRGRPVQKPTLGRVFRRAAIFGPVLAVFVYLTGRGELSPAGIAFNTVVLLAFFIPFSYLVDVLVYRAVLRRQGSDRGKRR
jgi:hypothetical protein